MFSKAISGIILIVSALAAVPAAAQERPIKLESDVQLVRPASDGGEAQLVEPEGVVPGDTLVFTTSYRNEGSAPVSNFVIVNPVSAELLLSEEATAQTEVSIDGGKNWGRLSELTVTDNESQERPANADDITHLRWVISEVVPAAAGTVQFSATVR
jgi:uncharacterized repeat protein (TIGR01451 family)